jgi:type II secretory pathway component PulJ
MSSRSDIDGLPCVAHALSVTLADLLVSTAVLGLTLSATLLTLEQGQQAWAVGTARVEAQQSGRAALAWLAAELRIAGQGPGPRTAAALSAAEPARVVLHVDRNRDGTIAGPTELVTWRLAGDVLRRDAGGGAQPVVNGVRAFHLAYLDASGARTTDPTAVRRVSITLVTRADHATSRAARDLAAVFATDVHLRNR